MRRRAKPAKAKVEAQPPVARKSRKSEGSRVRELEKRLAEALGLLQTRNRELVEGREQQTAHEATLLAIELLFGWTTSSDELVQGLGV